jgi:ubiquinone/menaquinone biosynthesis C-methylase UbiE
MISPRNVSEATEKSKSAGLVLHAAAAYDLLVWLKTLGRERALRERMIALAQLEPGESVLDVGCGTGTLAIAARRQVGQSGSVCGVDASSEMIARASRKARRARLDVSFSVGVAQSLVFTDARFDAVTSTLMLHHLPRPARQECVGEMRRVVKPGGRVLVVDFGPGGDGRRGLLAHFHRHGHTHPREVIALLEAARLTPVKSGALGVSDLQYVLAKPQTS